MNAIVSVPQLSSGSRLIISPRSPPEPTPDTRRSQPMPCRAPAPEGGAREAYDNTGLASPPTAAWPMPTSFAVRANRESALWGLVQRELVAAAVGQDQRWPLDGRIQSHGARHRLLEAQGRPVSIKALPRRLRPRRQGRRPWTAVPPETTERAACDSVRWMRRRSPGPSCPREFSTPRSHREHRHRPLGGGSWRWGTRRRLGVVPKRSVAAFVLQPTAPSGPRKKDHPPHGTKGLPGAPLRTRPGAGLPRLHQAACVRSTAAVVMAAAATATAKAQREKGGVSPRKKRPACARSGAREVAGAVRRSRRSVAPFCSAARISARANYQKSRTRFYAHICQLFLQCEIIHTQKFYSNDGPLSEAQGYDKRIRPCTRATALLPMNISFMIFVHQHGNAVQFPLSQWPVMSHLRSSTTISLMFEILADPHGNRTRSGRDLVAA